MTTIPETPAIETSAATQTFLTNQEIIQAAHQNLGKGQWDNLVGGSESETTMRRNRLGFDRIAFRPRILVDVSHTNTSTTLLGHRLRIPVILAPMGSLQELTPAGAIAATRAAAEFGSLHVISSVTQPSLEETAASVDYPKVYQLYVTNHWDWVKETLTRVKSSGYWGFCLTVDTAHYRPARTTHDEQLPDSESTDPARPKMASFAHLGNDGPHQGLRRSAVHAQRRGNGRGRGHRRGARGQRDLGIQPRGPAARSRPCDDRYLA